MAARGYMGYAGLESSPNASRRKRLGLDFSHTNEIAEKSASSSGGFLGGDEEQEEEQDKDCTVDNTKENLTDAINNTRRARGRPPGSKNKPKLPLVVTKDSVNALKSHILEVADGADIVESLDQYARKRQRGLCVLSGTGVVRNLTLAQPSVPGTAMVLPGRFEILSLNGAFLPEPAPKGSSGLTVYLAGDHGQVVGGRVVGPLLACSTVLIIAAAFSNAMYDMLPIEDEEETLGQETQDGSGSGSYESHPELGGNVGRRRCDSTAVDETNITDLPSDPVMERSEADRLVDGVEFGELCNEFECISSPSVESSARQLARDIFEIRESNRALGTFAISVRYKDPLRSFVGREKYKRPLWATAALENPSVTLQEMVMLSRSVLSIKWTIRGKLKSLIAGIGGDLILKVDSQFTMNQISGQVTEHQEIWDLSASSDITRAFFWTSRGIFAIIESAKDLAETSKNLISSRLPAESDQSEMYPDPSDPTKFFQDDSFQRDAYQVALFLAVLYLVVQILMATL